MDLRFLWLLVCFLLSGFAALLYQTVWTRELAFVFGTSELAVAAVLAAYMAGLALGAAAAARFAPRLRRPVLAYGVLEAAIALTALAVPAGLRLVNALYIGWLGSRAEIAPPGAGPAAVFQVAAAFAVLLLPTAFMGATLPLLTRHAVRHDREVGPRVGALYATNTAGAIAGALCAAFWLVPELGLRRTVWVGAVANVAVFGFAVLLARGAPPAAPGETAARTSASGASWMLPAIAVSGAVSFAYEVLWTRMLGHELGASLQAFASMLASFLLGIALGSAIASRIATTHARSRVGFAWAQIGIAATAYAAFAFVDRIPEVAALLARWLSPQPAGAAIAVVWLLPTTLCIGATFPFAVRWVAGSPQAAASATARVYAWNTVGAIAGALGAGFVLLPELGYAGTLGLGVGVSLGLALVAALASSPRRGVAATVAAAAAVVLALAPARPPDSLLRYSPLRHRVEAGELVFAAVGRSSTVVVLERQQRFVMFTNGLPEAQIERHRGVFTSAFTNWLGLLPAMIRPDARDMLVVGLGGGSGIEWVPDSIASIDVIELEPEVVAANRHLADLRGRDPLADPRVRVHVGDARGTLQLAAKRFDAIVSQPSHPWTAGASHLYTEEFFSLVRERLGPDGVFVQWIAPQFVDEALLRSLLATLDRVFGHVEVYAPDRTALLFAASPAPVDGVANAARAIAAAPGFFERFGVHRVEDFAAMLVLGEEGVRALAAGAPPNTDDENRLATHATRLGASAFDWDSAQTLFAAHDPWLAHSENVSLPALVRSLTRWGPPQRATEVAKAALDEAERERGLGWAALSRRRMRSAARHFERALELAPGDRDASAGLAVSRRHALASGPLPEIDESTFDPHVSAVVAGWRLDAAGDVAGLAAIDAELARIPVTHPLFRYAARLRADWRIASGGTDAGAEAARGLARALDVMWTPEDALELARAAALAGDPEQAWASLQRIAFRVAPGRRGRALRTEAADLAERLPPDPFGGIAEALRSGARR